MALVYRLFVLSSLTCCIFIIITSIILMEESPVTQKRSINILMNIAPCRVIRSTKNSTRLNSDLRSIGRIIIYFPAQITTGGPAALNYLHCSLVKGGFNSFMHIPNPHYVSEKCSRSISENFEPTAKDLVIVPENVFTETFPTWRANGSRIVVYMLGLHVPLTEQHRTDVIWAPSSTYTRDIFLATGKQVLFAPLEKHLYEIQKNDSKNERGHEIYAHLKEKENLIFLDDDFTFPSRLRTKLTNLTISPRVKFKVLSGIPSNEVHTWFQRSKVIIDLGLPGVERINYEGALFDNIVLIADVLNGADENDFPVPREFKLDTRNETQMFETIKNCLINYSKLIPLWRPLKQLTLDLPYKFQHINIPSFFSSRSVKFFLRTSTLEQESALIPFALHCAVHYPLARIEALVPNLSQFKRNHDMMLKVLQSVTNLSPDWLWIKEDSDNRSPVTNGSEFIIFIDPRNFLIDEALVNILVHLLEEYPAVTLHHPLFGEFTKLAGDITIARSSSLESAHKLQIEEIIEVSPVYSKILQKQIINIYAKREKKCNNKTAKLATALYTTQKQKLLQTILPLAVPYFTETMTNFEKYCPKLIL